jgi:outer membrane beta-barrel protein
MMTNSKLLSASIAAATLLASPLVSARESPLADQPDVRNKYEYRDGRFELAPTFEMTINADYKNTVSGGAKLEYHFSDSLSAGATIFFGTGVDTSLASSVRDSLPDTRPGGGDPTPARSDFDGHLNTMPLHGSVQATFTPWFGKMALFGKAFIAFDIYVTGGFGFAQLKTEFAGGADCSPVADGTDPMTNEPIFNDPRNDCPHNAGFKPGLMIGAGMHIYFNKWIALDISFRDYFFSDNPSGQDADFDRDVDADDPRFLGHLFFGVGLSFMLPPKVKVTR